MHNNTITYHFRSRFTCIPTPSHCSLDWWRWREALKERYLVFKKKKKNLGKRKFRRECDDHYLFRSTGSLFADIELSFFHPLLKLKDVLVIIAPVRLKTFVLTIRSQHPPCKRAHRSPVGRAHHARGDVETLRSLHFRKTCRNGGYGFQVSQGDVSIITQIWLVDAGDLSIKGSWWDGPGLGWRTTLMQRATNLEAFVLHVWTAEDIIHVFFGHGLEEVAYLLLPPQGTHPSRYYRIVCNTD